MRWNDSFYLQEHRKQSPTVSKEGCTLVFSSVLLFWLLEQKQEHNKWYSLYTCHSYYIREMSRMRLWRITKMRQTSPNLGSEQHYRPIRIYRMEK